MKRWFQQIVSIISQFNSNKQSWFSKAAVHKSLHSALKNFAKFKWKHLHWSHLINSLQTCYCIKKRLHCEQQVFSCIFCKMLKNSVLFIFFQKTSWWLLLVFSFIFYWFLPPSKILDTRFFLFLNMFSHNFWWWSMSLILCLENFSPLWETRNLLAAAWDHTFPWDIPWNLEVI